MFIEQLTLHDSAMSYVSTFGLTHKSVFSSLTIKWFSETKHDLVILEP